MIRQVEVSDAKAINAIYNHYVEHSIYTFDEEYMELPDTIQMIKSIQTKYPFNVFVDKDKVVGYAYADKWKIRSAYKRTVETSVYIHPEYLNKGTGTFLYSNLINQLRNQEVHALIAGISLPNERSVRLHERLGFVKVAHFKEIGFKFQKWVDVGYWELIFNKR